jgi:hypothetical protein
MKKILDSQSPGYYLNLGTLKWEGGVILHKMIRDGGNDMDSEMD